MSQALVSLPPPSSLEELRLIEVLALHALVRARSRYRPLAPTVSCAIDMVRTLVERGVVAVPWPQLQWPEHVMGEHTAYERIGWRLNWPAIADENLDVFLTDLLVARTCDWPPPEDILDLWRRFAAAEAIDYLGHQLAMAGLTREWSADSAPALAALTLKRPLTQVRYFIWAAVRAGSSAYLRFRGEERMTRDAIVRELAVRPSRADSGKWSIKGFEPKDLRPFSLAADALATHLLRVPADYWQRTPSQEALQIS